MNTRGPLTAADLITLTGYAAGIWWSVGGPTWSAIYSMIADEVDGPAARRMGTAGPQGADLDWGTDVALTPLALMRLGRTIGQPQLTVAAAPLVLAVQARLHSQGWTPPVGSARAGVMLATIAIEQYQKRNPSARPKGLRANPATARRALRLKAGA